MDPNFPPHLPGIRMGCPGFPGQLPNTSSWGDVSITHHQPAPVASMPPPGFGPSERCSDCFHLGAQVNEARIGRDEIQRNYLSLMEEHKKCFNYTQIIEKLQKELDETKRKNADLEKKLEAIQEPAKPQMNSPAGIGEEVQALNSKSTVNQESVEPQGDMRNAKVQSQYCTRPVGDSSYPKKRPEKRRDLGNESQKGEVVKEHPSVGNDSNSARNTNRPNTEKREDHRQPKSMVTVNEIKGDLFQGTEDYSLAHCVGSDFIMSSGIAIGFRKQFRRIGELLSQNKVPGEVAFLQVGDDRYIYYLVTKLCSTGKPTWEDFIKAVQNLRKLCESHNVKHLAMPQIGCGLDLLPWTKVRALLQSEFAGTDIEIRVYWKEAEARTEKQRWNLKLYNNPGPLSQIDPEQCAIVFLASTDGHVTPQMEELDKKFRFLHHYKHASRAIGSLYACQPGRFHLFGFMLKQTQTDEFSFPLLNECLIKMKKVMKQNGLSYIGLEAFEDPKHMIIMHKIWSLVTEVFFIDRFEVHFYWPDGVKEGWNEGLIS